MTRNSFIDRLTETLLAALKLPGDDTTYGLVYWAVQNTDEVETPNPRLQAIFIVEAVEAALGLGLDIPAFDEALTAVVAILPAQAELEVRRSREQQAMLLSALHREIPPDAHLEMAFEDRVNGGLDNFD